MTNHLSFHAGVEGKLKKSDIKGLAGHTFRRTEQRYKNHGNKDIDTSKTKYNVDWTITNQSLDEVVDDRLKNEYKGKRALRKDAVVVREIIAQASPSIYEGLTIEEKQKMAVQFTNDSLKWFRGEFGSRNVIGASVHMDETNPHTHFAIMPMTKDGRVSQKDFFKGPNDLKRQHREYRKHMNELGWEFEEENKYSQQVEGVPLEQYKETALEVELKRSKHDALVEELKYAPDVRSEAVDAVFRDIYDGTLRSERERLDREKKAVEDEKQALKERERVMVSMKQKMETLFLAVTKDVKAIFDQKVRDRVAAKGLGGVSERTLIKTMEYSIIDAVDAGQAEKLKRDVALREETNQRRKPDVVQQPPVVEDELELG